MKYNLVGQEKLKDGKALWDNDYIKEDFGLSGMLKMGAEVKITPQFAIRAGGAWQT